MGMIKNLFFLSIFTAKYQPDFYELPEIQRDVWSINYTPENIEMASTFYPYAKTNPAFSQLIGIATLHYNNDSVVTQMIVNNDEKVLLNHLLLTLTNATIVNPKTALAGYQLNDFIIPYLRSKIIANQPLTQTIRILFPNFFDLGFSIFDLNQNFPTSTTIYNIALSIGLNLNPFHDLLFFDFERAYYLNNYEIIYHNGIKYITLIHDIYKKIFDTY